MKTISTCAVFLTVAASSLDVGTAQHLVRDWDFSAPVSTWTLVPLTLGSTATGSVVPFRTAQCSTSNAYRIVPTPSPGRHVFELRNPSQAFTGMVLASFRMAYLRGSANARGASVELFVGSTLVGSCADLLSNRLRCMGHSVGVFNVAKDSVRLRITFDDPKRGTALWIDEVRVFANPPRGLLTGWARHYPRRNPIPNVISTRADSGPYCFYTSQSTLSVHQRIPGFTGAWALAAPVYLLQCGTATAPAWSMSLPIPNQSFLAGLKLHFQFGQVSASGNYIGEVLTQGVNDGL